MSDEKIPKEICPVCNGERIKLNNTTKTLDMCPKCKGAGKLDWIEMTMSARSAITLAQFYDYLIDKWKDKTEGIKFRI